MSSRVLLSGSYRKHPADSIFLGEPPPDDVIQITLLLKRRTAGLERHVIQRHLSSAELGQLHGADPADIQATLSHHNTISALPIFTKKPVALR
jgi:hypothetical protein